MDQTSLRALTPTCQLKPKLPGILELWSNSGVVRYIFFYAGDSNSGFKVVSDVAYGKFSMMWQNWPIVPLEGDTDHSLGNSNTALTSLGKLRLPRVPLLWCTGYHTGQNFQSSCLKHPVSEYIYINWKEADWKRLTLLLRRSVFCLFLQIVYCKLRLIG